MSPSSDERMAELRELFYESAEELLQALNDQGLKLEKSPADPEIVRTIRRVVHTLKGDAAACGYRELSELAHELEDALAVESAGAHAQMPQVRLLGARPRRPGVARPGPGPVGSAAWTADSRAVADRSDNECKDSGPSGLTV